MLLLLAADFFQNSIFEIILSETLSECQTVWIQIRTDIGSVLIWVQTVCKALQQATRNICIDFSLNVKAAPHECVIRTSQP